MKKNITHQLAGILIKSGVAHPLLASATVRLHDMEKVKENMVKRADETQDLASRFLHSSGSTTDSAGGPTGVGVLDTILKHPVLAATVASGVLGGAVTASTKKRPGETDKDRRKRIINNALISAAGGAGVAGLANLGIHSINTAVPVGDKDPVVSKFTSPTGRALSGVAGVATTHGLGAHYDKGMNFINELESSIGKNKKLNIANLNSSINGRDQILNAIEGRLGIRTKPPTAWQSFLKAVHLSPAERELYAVGLPVPGLASDIVGTNAQKSLKMLDNVAGRPVARTLYNLFGPGAKLSGTGRFLRAPIMRTGIGLGAGLLLPEAVNLVSSGVRNYLWNNNN